MFILQEINNYETTRSDEFCELDREIIQNTTRSCFTTSKKIHGSKTCNWLNTRDVSLFRNIVYIKRISNFLIFTSRKWAETLNRSNWKAAFRGSVTLQLSLWVETGVPGENPQYDTFCFELFFYRLDKTNAQMARFEAFVAYNEATWKSTKTSFRITRKLFQTSKHHEKMISFSRRNDYYFEKEY